MTKYRFFTAEEERELFRKVREDGCLESRRLLIESVIALAMKLTHRHYIRPGNPNEHDELISCAHRACIKAVDRFDCSRGTRLSTTIGWSLQAEVARRFHSEPIYIPPHVDRESKELEPLLNPLRLNWGTENGAEMYVPDRRDHVAEFFDGEEASADMSRVRWAIDQLPDRLRAIITARFYDGKTLHEVGEQIGVTRERVRQLEGKALAKLKDILPTYQEKEPMYEDDHTESGDIMQAIESLTSVQLDERIAAIEAERAKAIEQFNQRLAKLKGIRKAMFGGPPRKARAKAGEIEAGSATDKIRTALQKGAAVMADIAKATGLKPQAVAVALRHGDGRLFKKDKASRWSLVA